MRFWVVENVGGCRGMEGDGGRCDFRGDVGWRGMELELGMVGAKTGS